MKKFSYYILIKDFNTGKIEPYNVMPSLYGSIFTSNGRVSKRWLDMYKVKDKESFRKFVDSHFRYCYWAKCEFEFIASDWPPTKMERDVKIDGYQQLKPNIDFIVDALWKEFGEKICKCQK